MTAEQVQYIIDLLGRAEFEDSTDEDRAELAIELLEGAIEDAEEDDTWFEVLDRDEYFEMLEDEEMEEEGLIAV